MTYRVTEASLDRAHDERIELEIVVNGERRAVAAGSTVGDLLRSLGLDLRMVVVERNRAILRDRAAVDSLALAPGDVLEIVHFVGGG